MDNSFAHIGVPDKIFDLKGSIHNRRAGRHSKVGLDLNFIDDRYSILIEQSLMENLIA